MNEINKNIKKYRLIRNMSQDQLAEKVSSTKNTIRKWESGDITPSIDILKNLSKSLSVPLYSLLGEDLLWGERISNRFKSIVTWLFVWIHIDLTLCVAFSTMAISILIASIPVTFAPISLLIWYSISGIWSSNTIGLIIASVFGGPAIGAIMLMFSYYVLTGVIYVFNFSLSFFWKVIFRIKPYKIHLSKKLWIIVASCVAAGLVIFLTYIGVNVFSNGGDWEIYIPKH